MQQLNQGRATQVVRTLYRHVTIHWSSFIMHRMLQYSHTSPSNFRLLIAEDR